MAPSSAGVAYLGMRGNHLTRFAEWNPFEPVLGHRYNPNLTSPLLMVLTDAQSFYTSASSGESVGIARFVEAWEIVLTMSVSRAVSRDSTSLVTMLNAPLLAPPN